MEWWSDGNRQLAALQHSTTSLLQHSVFIFSPDVTDQFTAQVLFAGFHAGHHAARRGDDGRAHAPEDARDFRGADVASQPRLAHALETHDDALASLIFQLEFQFFEGFSFDRAVRDVTFLLEDM